MRKKQPPIPGGGGVFPEDLEIEIEKFSFPCSPSLPSNVRTSWRVCYFIAP